MKEIRIIILYIKRIIEKFLSKCEGVGMVDIAYYNI